MNWLASLLSVLAIVVPPRDAAVHPSDGPDVDVRILVSDSRVTVTLVLNLAFLDEVVDAPREDERVIHEVELPGIGATLTDHFSEALAVRIDGVQVAPVQRDVGFEAADPTLVPLFRNFGELALARVQLVLDYPVKTAPGELEIGWSDFPPDLAIAPDRESAPPVEVVANFTARGIMDSVKFTTDTPTFTWADDGESVANRFELVPGFAGRGERPAVLLYGTLGAGLMVLLIGVARRRPARVWVAFGVLILVAAPVAYLGEPPRMPMPSEEQALAIFRPLHANIYRAFDYVEEGEIYDALEQSVDGLLLDQLYDQVYAGLVIQEEGGAVSRVQAVRLLDSDVSIVGPDPEDGRPRFEVDARWQVDGSVFHFGHAHNRTHEYSARFTVHARDEGWRISGQEVTGQLRVKVEDDVPIEGR